MKRNKVKTLQNKCEKLWKEACFKRDGRMCQVKHSYPEVPLMHTNTIQVDHCFPRTCKQLKYDPSNGTPICSGCNHPHNKRARILIHKIVKQREGFEKYAQMEQEYLSKRPFPEYSKIWWLEDKLNENRNIF